MSSYKPPFARRLARTSNNKPAPRGKKNTFVNVYADTTTTTTPVNVTEALTEIGLTDEVIAEATVEVVTETTVWTMDNKKTELLVAAEGLGLAVDTSMTKATILEAINGAG